MFQSDPNISDIDFETIKSWAKKIGSKDPFSAKINDLNDDKWLDFLITGGKYDKNNEFIQNIQPISHTVTNIDYFNFIVLVY